MLVIFLSLMVYIQQSEVSHCTHIPWLLVGSVSALELLIQIVFDKPDLQKVRLSLSQAYAKLKYITYD